MLDDIKGIMPEKLYFVSLLTILRQCVDPTYRNYYSPYTLDAAGRPNEQRFFGKKTGPDPIIVLAQRVDTLANKIEVEHPDGLDNLDEDFAETCRLYNRWYAVARMLRHEYDFTFPQRIRPARETFTQEPEFDFLTGNGTAQPPAVPYPAPTTAADEATISRLHRDRRYATGNDRSDIIDRLGNS